MNPDFGQVESDPAVLNLSAFETFLSERRPFFVEGTGFYRFALNCYIVVDCSTNEGLFYSRRIGRAPHARLNDLAMRATPTVTPIAAATKLTGRTRSGLSFGLLDALTQHVERDATDETVEPRTNYAVLRAQQDLRGGNAGISVIATAVNRALDDWTRPGLHEQCVRGRRQLPQPFPQRQLRAGRFVHCIACSRKRGSDSAYAEQFRSLLPAARRRSGSRSHAYIPDRPRRSSSSSANTAVASRASRPASCASRPVSR